MLPRLKNAKRLLKKEFGCKMKVRGQSCYLPLVREEDDLGLALTYQVVIDYCNGKDWKAKVVERVNAWRNLLERKGADTHFILMKIDLTAQLFPIWEKYLI